MNSLLSKIYDKFNLNSTQNSATDSAKGGGVRQAATNINRIRADHRGRYLLAAKYVQPGMKVLDLACGVGYGSHIIASNTPCSSILAIDIAPEAIRYGEQHYAHPNIHYRCDDALTTPLESNHFDMVISFETIEHLTDYTTLLTRFHQALTEDGTLILSTPNEIHQPFDPAKFTFHVRHFTPAELQSTLEEHGFVISQVFAQPKRRSTEVVKGWDGLFNIVICKKRGQ